MKNVIKLSAALMLSMYSVDVMSSDSKVVGVALFVGSAAVVIVDKCKMPKQYTYNHMDGYTIENYPPYLAALQNADNKKYCVSEQFVQSEEQFYRDALARKDISKKSICHIS